MDAAATVVARANDFEELNPLLKNDYWILVKFSLAILILVLLFKRVVLLKLVGISLILIAATMLGWVGLVRLLDSGKFPL